IYQELLAKKFIELDKVSLSTVQRYLRKTKISTSALNTKDRRAFEMEYPNDCWQSDVSTGLYFKTTFSRFNPGGENTFKMAFTQKA
ncbi:hypothetical protein U2053_14645, partial [Listeria monocytogenes]